MTPGLVVAGVRIEGISVGGVETCFALPDFGVCLDIGRCPPWAIRHEPLLLTHGHIDHSAGLPYYVSMRAMRHLPPPTIVCPAPSRAALIKGLEAWAELQNDSLQCRVVGVEGGAEVDLGPRGFARAFQVPHRTDALGYTIFRRTRRLKPALAGLAEEEIAARAKGGEEVHEWSERAELCFPGDTTIRVIDLEPSVTQARVLLLECTFVGSDVSPEEAEAGGHVHLEHLVEAQDRFENEAIVLTHFSRRYSRRAVEEAVHHRLSASLRSRIELLLPD